MTGTDSRARELSKSEVLIEVDSDLERVAFSFHVPEDMRPGERLIVPLPSVLTRTLPGQVPPFELSQLTRRIVFESDAIKPGERITVSAQ